jgi:hypothetical protein
MNISQFATSAIRSSRAQRARTSHRNYRQQIKERLSSLRRTPAVTAIRSSISKLLGRLDSVDTNLRVSVTSETGRLFDGGPTPSSLQVPVDDLGPTGWWRKCSKGRTSPKSGIEAFASDQRHQNGDDSSTTLYNRSMSSGLAHDVDGRSVSPISVSLIGN